MAEQGLEPLGQLGQFTEQFSVAAVAAALLRQEVPRSMAGAAGVEPRRVLRVPLFLEGPGEGLELQGPLQVVVVARPARAPAEASVSLLSRSNSRWPRRFFILQYRL